MLVFGEFPKVVPLIGAIVTAVGEPPVRGVDVGDKAAAGLQGDTSFVRRRAIFCFVVVEHPPISAPVAAAPASVLETGVDVGPGGPGECHGRYAWSVRE